MCIFSNLIIWELHFKVQTSFKAQNFVLFLSFSLPSSSPPSSSYQWLPMVVSLYLTHLLLEVVSSVIFVASPFCFHSSSRSKGLHWWRGSKAYKLYMGLHHVVSRAYSSRWCSFASSIFLFGQFTLIPYSSSYSSCISSIVLWFGVV